MGIDVPRMTLLSFALAAVIGAIGGIVVAPITSLQFDSGRFFTTIGFIAVAIGGMGSFVGAVVGGLVLGVAEQLRPAMSRRCSPTRWPWSCCWRSCCGGRSGLFATGVRGARTCATSSASTRPHPLQGPRRRASSALSAVAVLLVAALAGAARGLLSSLVITGILFIAVLGLDVLMGYAGQVSLGQAGFMAIGGYTAAILATNYRWPPLAGVRRHRALAALRACAVAGHHAAARPLSGAGDAGFRAAGRFARRSA